MDPVLSSRLNPSALSSLVSTLARALPLGLMVFLSVGCGGQGDQSQADDAAQEEAVAEPDTSFVLLGALVDEQGNPLSGLEIWVYRAYSDDEGYYVEFDEGHLVNPTAVTDQTGHFEIEVQRSFLPPSQAIKLTVKAGGSSSSASPLTTDDGIPIVLEVGDGTRTIDLEGTMGKVVVRSGT